MIAYEDPSHPGNSPMYQTGMTCVVKGCDKPAGTWWSPYWCFEHNVERIRRISANLDDIIAKAKVREGRP